MTRQELRDEWCALRGLPTAASSSGKLTTKAMLIEAILELRAAAPSAGALSAGASSAGASSAGASSVESPASLPQPPLLSNSTKVCGACTFINAATAVTCEMCRSILIPSPPRSHRQAAEGTAAASDANEHAAFVSSLRGGGGDGVWWPPRCPSGHEMRISSWSGLGYTTGYVCAVCSGQSSQGHCGGSRERWFCHPCSSDCCFSCVPRRSSGGGGGRRPISAHAVAVAAGSAAESGGEDMAWLVEMLRAGIDSRDDATLQPLMAVSSALPAPKCWVKKRPVSTMEAGEACFVVRSKD